MDATNIKTTHTQMHMTDHRSKITKRVIGKAKYSIFKTISFLGDILRIIECIFLTMILIKKYEKIQHLHCN
jgi:hypothetical protein